MTPLVDTQKRLLSTVPAFVLRALESREAVASAPMAERFSAAVLFADIVGFTPTAERLAGHGSRGVEELSTLLNDYFGRLIDIVATHGGETYRFAGDALLAIWTRLGDGDAESLAIHGAAQCALNIQAALHDYQAADNVRLALRIGVGAGQVLAAHLGGVDGQFECLLAGDPLHQIGAAARQATPGGVVISPEAYALAQEHIVVQVSADGALRLVGLRAALAIAPSSFTPWPARLVDAARRYVPLPVISRLEEGQSDWLAELRRVTTLFVNVAGIDDTPADMLDRLQVMVTVTQKVLSAYEGALCHVVVGDKGTVLLGAFGLPPFSHEDDAGRGVFAANTLQTELRRSGLQSSIGIATGLVFCGLIGNDLRREYTLTGDPVNVAARLMEAASGDVLCDTRTREAARTYLDFVELPALLLKGKTEPTAVFRPTRRLEPARLTAPLGSAVLIGREAEREVLARQLRTFLDSGTGTTIFVEGEAGIGKSRLLSDFLDRAQQLGVNCLFGAGDAIQKSTSYHAWASIFRQLFRLQDASDDSRALRANILTQLSEQPAVRQIQGAPGPAQLAPLLDVVLSLDFEDTELTAAMSVEARADNTRELLIELLERAASWQPLMLIVDDGQWLDSSSWLLLRLVSQRVRQLLIVVALRPESAVAAPFEYRELLAGQETVKLPLGPLTTDETIRLVCQRLVIERLPAPVVTLISEKADGHPFYAEELAYAIRDAGAILIEDGRCTLASGAGDFRSLPLPSTLQSVITSRIDRLTASQQLTLKVASVIGREVSLSAVRDIFPAHVDPDLLARDLEVLERLDFLHLDTVSPDSCYSFRHALTQEVTYNLMLFAQRRRLHRAAAEWYEATHADEVSPGLLAHHWSHALSSKRDEPNLTATAMHYLEKAGEAAIRTYANVEAIRYYDQALRLATDLQHGPNPLHDRAPSLQSRMARWEHNLGEAYFQLGKMPESAHHLRRALALMGFPTASTKAGLIANIVAESTRQILRQMLPRVFLKPVPDHARPSLTRVAEVYARLGLVTFIAMQELASISALLRGHNIAERAGPCGVLMKTSYQMANFTHLLFANPRLQEHYFGRALRIVKQVAAPDCEAEMWFGRGFFLIIQARWSEAEEVTARAQALYARLGDRRWVELCLFQRANVAMLRGDLVQGLAWCLEASRSASDRGDVQAQAWMLIAEAHARLMLGWEDAALRILDDVDDRLATSQISLSDPAAQFWGAATRALGLARRGDTARALQVARTAVELIKPYIHFTYYSVRGLGNLAEACFTVWESLPIEAKAERKIVQQIARKSIDAAVTFKRSSPCGQPQALLWTGQLASLDDRPDKAQRALQQALLAAERLAMPYEAGLAHWLLGRGAVDADACSRHRARAAEVFTRLSDGYHLARLSGE